MREQFSGLSGNLFLFALVFLSMLLLNIINLQYYEGHTDPGISAYFNSVITIPPNVLPNDGNWKYIGDLFTQLYIWKPHLDWYGFSVMLVSSFVMFVFLKIIKLMWDMTPHTSIGYLIRFGTICCLGLHLENIVLLEFTRLSQTLGFMGFFTLVAYPALTTGSRVVGSYVLTGWLAVILSGLIRIQPAMLSLAVVAPIALVLLWNRKIRPSTLIINFFPPLIFLVFLALKANDVKTQSDQLVVDNAGYLINIWDIEPNEADFKLMDEKDSLTYTMAKLHFMNDIENINPAFFEKIGVQYTNKQLNSVTNLLTNNISIFNKLKSHGVWYLERHIGWSITLLGLWLLTLLAHRHNPVLLTQAVLMLIYFTGLYFGIAVFIKMADRIFSPLFLAFCACLLLHSMLGGGASNVREVRLFGIFQLTIGILLILGLFSELRFSLNLFHERRTEIKYYDTVLGYANALGVKYQFIGYASGWLFPKPLQTEDRIDQKATYLSIDNQAFCYMASYQRKMQMVTGHDSVEGYWQFMLDHSDECIIISEQYRLERIVEYFNLQYDLDMKIIPIVSDFKDSYPDPPDNAWSVGIFRITK